MDNTLIMGIDEAGRGPLAGEVYAAAVILAQPIEGLNDSKKLSAKRRETLAAAIREQALAYAVATATVAEIDRLNILQASMLAMTRAFQAIHLPVQHILIDGNRVPSSLPHFAQAVVKGDQQYPCIMAASILAKTARDARMMELHQQYPEYAFDQHKGYGTALHLERLHQYGATPYHRRSFAPVKKVLR